MIMATLDILRKVKTVDVRHVELLVLRIIVVYVRDGFSLINGDRKDDSVATGLTPIRVGLVEYPHQGADTMEAGRG